MPKMLIKFEAKLTAGIKFDEAANVFITYAPALDLYSQGETELQAKHAMRDAIRSFLLVAYKNKVLDKCLKINGFTKDAFPSTVEVTAELPLEATEYINVEEMILEREKYRDVFEVPAMFPSLEMAACR